MPSTDPIDSGAISTAPRLAIAPSYKDHQTGALYIHEDLKNVQGPWAEEAHIPPVHASEKFGDVASWVEYVKRFSGAPDFPPFLTWSPKGLMAVLDYHRSAEEPGRAQWTAECPFERSIEWRAWRELANGQPIAQQPAVEKLEDLGADIYDPLAADLMGLLRQLRSTVGMVATASLRQDGTATVDFSKDTKVTTQGKGDPSSVELPAEFKIRIPILKGHSAVGADGKSSPVLYELAVRIRVSVSNDNHLAFRFSMPRSEQALEAVYEDRVAMARELLGADLGLLRGGGG